MTSDQPEMIGCTPIYNPLDKTKIIAISVHTASGFGRFFFADGTEKDWPLGKGIEENTPEELDQARFAVTMPMPGWGSAAFAFMQKLEKKTCAE